MATLLDNAKSAIDAMNRPAETASANRWLVEFERTSEAWQIADQLSKDSMNASYRFFGAKILHSKVQKDFSQLGVQHGKLLMESIVQYIIHLSKQAAAEANLVRYLCLTLSSLALQLNTHGIVNQLLLWLNPVLSTQPTMLLELLMVLPEECYDKHVDVDSHTRDQFSQQLTQSAPEIFAFLTSLQSIATHDVESKILKCIERWLYNTDVPLPYTLSQQVFNYAMDCLNKETLCDDAVEIVITIIRKHAYLTDPDAPANSTLFPMLLQRLPPLIKLWNTQVKLLNADSDTDDFEVCRSYCRLFTEIGEGYMRFMIDVMGSANPDSGSSGHPSQDNSGSNNSSSLAVMRSGITTLMQQLVECLRFKFDFEIARIPLKFFYELSEYIVDCRKRFEHSDSNSSLGGGGERGDREFNDSNNNNMDHIRRQSSGNSVDNMGSRGVSEVTYSLMAVGMYNDHSRPTSFYRSMAGGSTGSLQATLNAPSIQQQQQHCRDLVNSFCENVYLQLLHVVVAQMLQPESVINGTELVKDDRESELNEWMDLATDCTHILGGEKALQNLCNVIQAEIAAASSNNNIGNRTKIRWDIVHACLSVMVEVVKHVSYDETRLMTQIIQFLTTIVPNAQLVGLQKVSTQIVGNSSRWLKHHPETLPALWQMLMQNMQVACCTKVACKATMHILSHCGQVTGLPIFDLHNTLLNMRNNNTISIENDLTLLEGICSALSAQRDLQQLIQGFNTIVEPILRSLSSQLHLTSSGSAGNNSIMGDIKDAMKDSSSNTYAANLNGQLVIQDLNRLTTVIQYTRLQEHHLCNYNTNTSNTPQQNMASHHPVIDMFPTIQTILAQVITNIGSESICEKVCRVYKYTIRACTLPTNNVPITHRNSFHVFLDPLAKYIVQTIQHRFYSAFLYVGAIIFSEFGLVNSTSKRISSNSRATPSGNGFNIPIRDSSSNAGDLLSGGTDSSNSASNQAEVQHINNILFTLLWSLTDVFFSRLSSIRDFENSPDMVEEYFYMISTALQYCAIPFFESVSMGTTTGDGHASGAQQQPQRLVMLLQAGLVGLQLRHREAQKGIMLFIQRFLQGVRIYVKQSQANNAASTVVYQMATTHFSLPLIKYLFKSLAADSQFFIVAVDEDNGSVIDALWACKLLLEPSTFVDYASQAIAELPADIQAIAHQKLFFPYSLLFENYHPNQHSAAMQQIQQQTSSQQQWINSSNSSNMTNMNNNNTSRTLSNIREREFFGLLNDFERRCHRHVKRNA